MSTGLDRRTRSTRRLTTSVSPAMPSATGSTAPPIDSHSTASTVPLRFICLKSWKSASIRPQARAPSPQVNRLCPQAIPQPQLSMVRICPTSIPTQSIKSISTSGRGFRRSPAPALPIKTSRRNSAGAHRSPSEWVLLRAEGERLALPPQAPPSKTPPAAAPPPPKTSVFLCSPARACY